jgi:hypothetical protein
MINAWERNIWISEFTPVVSGVRVTRSLVLCFVDLCLSFRTFSCGHCVVCSSSIYTDSDYPFGILWPLRCLFFFDIRILITPLVSCGHCVACSSWIYGFWLPLWYLVAIVLSVLLRYTDSDYLPLVSCGHCVVCSSSIYGFWLPPFGILWPLCCLFFFDIRILMTPLWYLVAIVLSVLLRYTDSDYPPLVSSNFSWRY